MTQIPSWFTVLLTSSLNWKDAHMQLNIVDYVNDKQPNQKGWGEEGIYSSSSAWAPGGFILASVKGEAAQGPFVSAAPSQCLRLYVWTWRYASGRLASGGMNGFAFSAAYTVRAYVPAALDASTQGGRRVAWWKKDAGMSMLKRCRRLQIDSFDQTIETA